MNNQGFAIGAVAALVVWAVIQKPATVAGGGATQGNEIPAGGGNVNNGTTQTAPPPPPPPVPVITGAPSSWSGGNSGPSAALIAYVNTLVDAPMGLHQTDLRSLGGSLPYDTFVNFPWTPRWKMVTWDQWHHIQELGG